MPNLRISEHEVTRRAHIKAETNLRAHGLAGIVFGIFCIELGVSVAFGVVPPNPNRFVSRGSGPLVLDINDSEPRNNSGTAQFTLHVNPPTAAEWLEPRTESCRGQ